MGYFHTIKTLWNTVEYFHTIKTLWDGQSKIKMYYGPGLKGSYREKDLLTFIHDSRVFQDSRVLKSIRLVLHS